MLQPQERSAFSTREALAARHPITKQAGYRRKERTLFYIVSKRTKCDSIDMLLRFAFCRAIGHHASELRDFGDPAAIILSIELDRER